MQIQKIKAKNIAETKNTKKDYLHINHSYSCFKLGDNIKKYLRKRHNIISNGNNNDDDDDYKHCYYFYEDKVEIWCSSSYIDVIRCNRECWYKGENLIGMYYKDFLILIKSSPYKSEAIYVRKGYKKNGENQMVYDFDKESLQVWVWRGKIVTILIS